jgi:hypothetical protein
MMHKEMLLVGRRELYNFPGVIGINRIGKAVAHGINEFAGFGVGLRRFLVYAYAVVFFRKVIDKGMHGRGYIMQPLFISFFYKSVAHNYLFTKAVLR